MGTDPAERVSDTLEEAAEEAADAAVHGGGDAPSPAVELLGRGGLVAYGVVHLLLAGLTVRLAVGDPTSGRAGPQLLVASLLALPGGRVLVFVAAGVVLVIAATMVYTGLSRSFLGDLVEEVPPRVRRVAAVLGLAGNLARAVAFGAVGVLFAVAGLRGDPRRVGGFDLALREIAGQWRGIAPLPVVAGGLGAFGVYCFVDARFRRAGVGTGRITRSR